MKDGYPDAWETITGTILQPGESRKKDERAFLAEHADDWLVQSAILSEQHPGFAEVIATRGGRHGHDVERRRFLVPSGEYTIGRFGFVVDPERHAECNGPSSFSRHLRQKGGVMVALDPRTRLFRMEEARRQTQHQLTMIERQITRRMTALIPQLQQRRTAYRRGKPPDPRTFLERYRSHLAAITAERQLEIDALSRKLARQDAAIAAFRKSHRFEHARAA